MENLNAERIKRGLECCKGSYDCFTCDIYKRGCAGFREGLAKDALALIKELTVELEAMRGAANSYKMHNERLAEENERLRAIPEQMKDRLMDTKTKICGEYYIYAENVNVIAKEILEGEK